MTPRDFFEARRSCAVGILESDPTGSPGVNRSPRPPTGRPDPWGEGDRAMTPKKHVVIYGKDT